MDRTCENCGTALVGVFCHACGQEDKTYVRGFFSLMREFFREFVNWDSRVARTLPPLLFKPGFLSSEYVTGRRASYVPPLRLYLFISIVFFLVLAMVARVDTDAMRDSLASTEVTRDGETTVDERPLSERINVNLPFLDEAGQAELDRRLDRIGAAPELLVRQMRTLAPTMMFLLLPVFALILQVLYIFKRRYYIEHLVLALHTHSFLFVMFMLAFGLGRLREPVGTMFESGFPTGMLGWVIAAIWAWIPVYLFIAQKRFYGQGWFMTTVKYFLTGTTYITMMLVFSVALLIASIMTA